MAPNPKRGVTPYAVAIALVVLTLAAYYPVFSCGYTNYDDWDYVWQNAMVQHGLTWPGIKWAFTTNHSANWHPITWLSLMLDCQLFGSSATANHAINLALHIANTLLLFALLRTMTGTMWRSAIVAALFAIHPLHVESVAWISERKDVLSTFIGLLVLIGYVKYIELAGVRGLKRKSLWIYLGLLLLFTLGLMAKQMLVTWPFVMLLMDFWPLRRMTFVNGEGAIRQNSNRLRPLLLEKVPFLTVSIASSIIIYKIQRSAGAMSYWMDVPARAANVMTGYTTYVWKIFWPTKLSVLYLYLPDYALLPVTLSLGFLTIATWLAWSSRNRFPAFSVGWFWFVGTLVPVIGIVQVGAQRIADRYTYIPAVGLFVAVAWSCFQLQLRWPRLRTLLVSAAVFIIAILAFLTNQQTRYWKNGETLFSEAVAHTTDNILALNNLANWRMEHNQRDLAMQTYFASLKIDPSDVEANSGISQVLADHGDFTNAWLHVKLAKTYAPNHPSANYALAYYYEKIGDHASAAKFYEQAQKTKPSYADPHIDLAHVMIQMGRYEDAISESKLALELKPQSEKAENNWGVALTHLGKMDEALPHFRRAIKYDPAFAEAYNNLAGALVWVGDSQSAVKIYEELLKQTDAIDVRFNYGLTLLACSRSLEALDQFQQVLRNDPNDAGARCNIARALTALGRLDEASQQYHALLSVVPDYYDAHVGVARLLIRRGEWQEAIVHLKTAMRLDPQQQDALVAYAWLLSTCPVESLRDGATALQLAQTATMVAREDDPRALDVLAAAYAETGKFTQAEQYCERAAALAEARKNTALLNQIARHKQSYSLNHSWRGATDFVE